MARRVLFLALVFCGVERVARDRNDLSWHNATYIDYFKVDCDDRNYNFALQTIDAMNHKRIDSVNGH